MTMTRKTRYNAPSLVSEMWKLIQKKPSNRLQRLEGQGFTKYFLFSQIFQTKVQLLRAKKVFHHCNSKQLFWGYVDLRTKAGLVVLFHPALVSEKWRKNEWSKLKVLYFSYFNSWNSKLFFWNYLWCIPLPWDISSTWATQPNCSSFWVCGQRVRLHNLK